MIPKIIHQTAKTYKVSFEENALIAYNKKKLSGYEFRFYNDEDNRQLIEKYFPQYLSQYDRINKGVAKSDIARLVYMHAFGGWYCDTDYKWVKEIPEKYRNAPCILPVSRQNERQGNAILASEAQHPFWGDFIRHIFSTNKILNLKENRIEKVTGPEGLTAFYMANKSQYEDCILFPERPVFHPKLIKWYYQKSPGTIGVHYCFGAWRTNFSLYANFKASLRKKIIALSAILNF